MFDRFQLYILTFLDFMLWFWNQLSYLVIFPKGKKVFKSDYSVLCYMIWPEHVSGAENGAERAENKVSGSGAVSGC